MTQSSLPAIPLGQALQKSAHLIPQDDEQPREEPALQYVRLRQKDLKSESTGEVIRPAGRFRIGKVSDTTYDDVEHMFLTILGYRKGRVYFESLGDAEPTCKSNDMINGSRSAEFYRGRSIYGLCADCYLAQWGTAQGGKGKGQACREKRQVFAFDLEHERPIVLELGVSSLKGWKAYDEFVANQAKELRGEDGKLPFIHHLIGVHVRPEYRSEPAGHYVVRFEKPEALPSKVQEHMATFRKQAIDQGLFSKAVEANEDESEDTVGN